MTQTTFILLTILFMSLSILLGIVVTLGIQAYNDRKRDREYRKLIKLVARMGG
jgi:hypothetical protein